MGPHPRIRRRALLGAAAAASMAACRPQELAPLQGAWVGGSAARGHQLRDAKSWPAPSRQRRAQVLIVGGGIAGLAAAHGFMQHGVAEVHLLELEDQAGGNSRGHRLGGMACPLGAHYLPLPGPMAHELSDWLHEIGLLRQHLGRSVADERHLCHSPQERLFIDGAWVEGLLPPAEPGSRTLAQYQQLAMRIKDVSKSRHGKPAFVLPAHRAAFGPEQAALDQLTFAAWLLAQGLDDAKLLWYLDYCCRDDYGAGIHTVSAWAGVHYFASRHGFHPPGDDEAERAAVFTWPEGNAWLVQRLLAPMQDRVHHARTVFRVSVGRHDVQVLAFDETAQAVEAWRADTVVLALPLHVASRIVDNPHPALTDAAAKTQHAPWLVANLLLDAPLLERRGAPPSWDNVIYGGASLGYVDAMHQSLRPVAGATVLTAYHALPMSQRRSLLEAPWETWAQQVLDELRPTHPDIGRRVQRVELMRWGHAMALPLPGQHAMASRAALRAMRGRLRFAHADLAGYSTFEEAFSAGHEAALP